jgi:hypothetical protein
MLESAKLYEHMAEKVERLEKEQQALKGGRSSYGLRMSAITSINSSRSNTF